MNAIRIILLFLFSLASFCLPTIHAQTTDSESAFNSTSIGFIIYSNDVETVWNALRLANFSHSEGDTVCVFLLGKGVEVETLTENNSDIKEQVDKLLDSGVAILGCGTCLQSRNSGEPKVCEFSSMRDLYVLVRKNKIVLTF